MTSHNPSSFSTEKQAKTDFRPKNFCIRAYFLLIDLYREQAEMRTPMETPCSHVLVTARRSAK